MFGTYFPFVLSAILAIKSPFELSSGQYALSRTSIVMCILVPTLVLVAAVLPEDKRKDPGFVNRFGSLFNEHRDKTIA